MDYEKAFKEALERAREYWETDNDNTLDIKAKGTMEYLFPELKESGDEKIKGAIIHFISHTPSVPKGVIGKETMLDWLEKQDKESPEKEFTFKALPRLLEMIEVSDRAKAYTEKLAVALDNEGYHTDAKIVRESIKIMNGEEVPMATMDEDEKTRKEIVGYLKKNLRLEWATWLEKQGTSYTKRDVDDAYVEGMAFAKDELEKQGKQILANSEKTCKDEQKPALDIEIPFGAKDSELQESTYLIPEGFHAEIKDNEVLIKKGKQKPTWSKKDEEIVTGIINDIQERLEDYPIEQLADIYFKEIKWLKSLKNRIKEE